MHGIKNVDVTKSRGQFYDGATAMSSKKIGVQSRIKEHSPTALYTRCNSQVLNLRIAASCKMPSMRHMTDNVNEITLFSAIHQRDKGFSKRLLINVRLPRK